MALIRGPICTHFSNVLAARPEAAKAQALYQDPPCALNWDIWSLIVGA